jgi:cell division protein FtsL
VVDCGRVAGRTTACIPAAGPPQCPEYRRSVSRLTAMETAYLIVLIVTFMALAAAAVYLLTKLFAAPR